MTHGCSTVSVIIPCFNAEQWIREAIDSSLAQTHPDIEVIVVDDGSTDGSLQLSRSYGARIVLETGPHRGGNHARNRGFALSRGRFIQFLDADDFLLPDKIARQVAFLEESGANVVYGDWRHQFHEPDGSIRLGDVQIAGEQQDLLESLLAGWWLAPAALLYRRQAVVSSGGWDETLEAGQDRDFLIAVAMAGADIRYQQGCQSVYRRYGPVTTSTSNRFRWVVNHQRILEKAEKRLLAAGKLSLSYRQALARSYFHLARNAYDSDRLLYAWLMERTLSLWPGFQPQESWMYNSTQRILGFSASEKLASLKRRLRH